MCALIDKKYGPGIVSKLTDEAVVQKDIAIPSGSMALDTALGIGGYGKGRIIEIIGPESSGKTTLCLHAIASVQEQGGTAVFIDAEHSLDPFYAQQLGVNLDQMYVVQPDYGEQALDIADFFVQSGEVDIIIVDSVAALVPKAELEGEMSDSSIGVQARLMSKAMRKLTGPCKKTNTAIIFTNQIRHKIGVMFGSPEVGSGGNALKFYASQRLDIRRTGEVKDGDVVIGHTTKVKVIKNKMSPPKKIAEFTISFGIGINRMADLIDVAVEDKIVNRSGAWYSYGDTRIGQGKANAMSFLATESSIRHQIEKRVLESRGFYDDPEDANEDSGTETVSA